MIKLDLQSIIEQNHHLLNIITNQWLNIIPSQRSKLPANQCLTIISDQWFGRFYNQW